MACGLPALISTETLEGAPDAADVIAAADLDVAAWIRAIERFDAQPSPRERVAEFAQQWNWNAAAERYRALFESLVGSGRATPPHTIGRRFRS
jgi:hypothetical protein